MTVLRERIHKLETRVHTLAAVVCVHKAMLRVSGFSLEHNRLPEGAAKWRLAERLDPTTTCEVLLEAGKAIGCVPTVVADSGVENVNEQVDKLIETGVLNWILALVEVAFSSSMIEACW